MSIQEAEFQVFIDAVQHYFGQTCGDRPDFQPPYILDQVLPLREFIGAIAVSGDYSGTVYFSADTPLLRDLLSRLGDPRRDPSALADAIGEVANTIAGNFRRDFGSRFVIAPPRVRRTVDGGAQVFEPRPDSTTYVVPLSLNARDALLLVELHQSRGKSLNQSRGAA